MVERGMAKASEVCRALSLSPSTYYATSQRSHQSLELEREAVELSQKNPRYGYRRIPALLRRSGHVVNEKRVQALRRRHGLQVRKKQRRMKRVHPNEAVRLTASEPNEVWSWDFVFDQTEWGSSYRILSVIDEHTRQCKSLRPRRSYRASNVIEVLEELIAEHGAPKYIRSDNGPEFIAYEIQDWLRKRKIKTHYIKPGSPWEQCYIESFHDKLRDEFLNREIFYSLAEAEIRLEDWREEYNSERIHSSLAYRTPEEFAACCNPAFRATPTTPACSSEEITLNHNHRPNLIASTV